MTHKKLSKKTRKKIIQVAYSYLYDSMFGDGLEKDYIMDGINFIGLNNMNDEELIQELELSGIDDFGEGEDYELLQKARKEMKRGK
ncbi:hypothetical protein KAR91_05990 [Candidatus Pacearchaeota archaeon]|nr:hypothetical protein [Candidatus Pacearchaeota archaeon]